MSQQSLALFAEVSELVKNHPLLEEKQKTEILSQLYHLSEEQLLTFKNGLQTIDKEYQQEITELDSIRDKEAKVLMDELDTVLKKAQITFEREIEKSDQDEANNILQEIS